MEIESVGAKRSTPSFSVRPLIVLAAILGWAVLCVFMFFQFRPDHLSLSDRYFPSPTNTPTRTPRPTPTPNYTATQRAIQATTTAQAVPTLVTEAATTWNILLSDGFDTDENRWEVGTWEDATYGTLKGTIAEGKYKWNITTKQSVFWWETPYERSLTDFFVTVTLQRTAGNDVAHAGLVFRDDPKGNRYYFALSDDNYEYEVSIKYNDNWITITDWNYSPAIRRDAPNRLTVIGQGSHFIFLINDQFVAVVNDNRLPSGKAGLAISVRGDSQAGFEFDDFELREP